MSYDTLNKEERQKLEQLVNVEKTKKRTPYIPECVVKSKSRHLDEFFKYSKYFEAVWFNDEPTCTQVEVCIILLLKEIHFKSIVLRILLLSNRLLKIEIKCISQANFII